MIVFCLLISALSHPHIKTEKEWALKPSYGYRPIAINVKVTFTNQNHPTFRIGRGNPETAGSADQR